VVTTADDTEKMLEELSATYCGHPPIDFNDRIDVAGKLGKLALEVLGYDLSEDVPREVWDERMQKGADALLFAALMSLGSMHNKRGPNDTTFVSRARQIAKWCVRPIPEITPLGVLENKLLELSHRVASGLLRGDEFILLLMNKGDPNDRYAPMGHTTWASSCSRASAREVMRDLVRFLDKEASKS
jgi:hypothetical protein